MKNNNYTSIEMSLVSEIDGVLCVAPETCDVYGTYHNSNKMNLLEENPKKDFLSKSNGFIIEKVSHKEYTTNTKPLLLVLDRYPYTLNMLRHKFGINSNIYRQAIGYSIKDDIDLFIFNTDKSIIIPVKRDNLVITNSDNYNEIIDEISRLINQNNAIKQSVCKIKKLYKGDK